MINSCPYEMPTADTVCSIEGFLYFVWERETIRIARENGFARPWTIDPILDKYKFCNIRRKDDRVTKWLIEHVYTPYLHNDDNDLWFVAAICRLINWPPTILRLLVEGAIPAKPEDFNPTAFARALEDLREDNVPKIYTGAYMIYPGRETGMNKSEFLAHHVLDTLVLIADDVRSELKGNSVEYVVNVLSAAYGISTFIAGQIAADLTYFDSQLGRAEDLYNFAPLGPGSQQGLNHLLGYKINRQWKQGEFNRVLIMANTFIKKKLEITDLTLHDVQNCFCEYGKYARTLLGGGATPRSIYKPETQF